MGTSKGLWGKTGGKDTLLMQRYDQSSLSWVTIDIVGVSGASNNCRSLARNSGIPHRVWNKTTNTLFCESV